MNSFIRWAGSKRSVLHHLRRYWPGEGTRYIEPFAGSACLFFDLQPTSAILGDLNEELMCTMRCMKLHAYAVLECMRRLPVGKSAYYRVRAIDPLTLSENEIAARFLYLNRYCFNGLYRTNTSGKFNVPYGPPKSQRPPDEDLILATSHLLQGASLVAADFEVTLALAQPGDFVYIDPPYAVSRRRIFQEYLPSSFSNVDLHRLGKALDRLDALGTRFLISYADCAESRNLLKKWHPKRIWTRRNIAGFAGCRRGSYELLATNRLPD